MMLYCHHICRTRLRGCCTTWLHSTGAWKVKLDKRLSAFVELSITHPGEYFCIFPLFPSVYLALCFPSCWFFCPTYTHTHTHPFNGHFSRTTRVSWYQTDKTNRISLKQETVSGSGISWAICNSAPHSRQITTPAPHHSVFYRLDVLSAAKPTVSKHWRPTLCVLQWKIDGHSLLMLLA